MKNIALSVSLFFLATTVFAQKNTAFGVVLQVGNFTSPYHKTVQNYAGAGGIYTNYNNQNAGSAYTLGIKESFRLGGYFRVSASVLYRLASFSTSELFTFGSINGTPITTNLQSQKVTENSIAIPIKLHFSLKKDGQTSIVLGAGVARVLRSEFKARNDSKIVSTPQNDHAYQYPDLNLDMRAFKPNMLLTAGIYHSINKSTSLGLEFSYEQRSENQRYSDGITNFNEPFIDIVDCFCYGFLYLKTPSMRSWSVSLNHNLSE